MLPMTRPAWSATKRAVVYALTGFVAVLFLGMAVSRSIGGDSFADLGLAATTPTVLAPLGALGGALLAARRHRRIALTPADRAVFGWVMIAAWALTMIAYTMAGPTAALTVLILETAALVIVRMALAHGALDSRRGSRRGPRRPLRLRS